MDNQIVQNLAQIKSRIQVACERCGRDPQAVKLLLATKTVSADRILQAFEAGESLIAENKVQELKEKFDLLQIQPHTNHFIGHLQSNKIKEILKYQVTCLQSLDRLELAEKLQQRLAFENKSLDVLIQVNTSNEASKFGVAPDQVISLIQHVSKLANLRIKGLMTIGLFSAEPDQIRPCFQLLKSIQHQVNSLQIPGVEMDVLSMGMSGDLEIAIEEGSTLIRVGTAIFGERQYPDSYYWNEGRKREELY